MAPSTIFCDASGKDVDFSQARLKQALFTGASFEGAARLANYAGGLVVMKRGTATVTADELKVAIDGDHGGSKKQDPPYGRRKTDG